MLSLERGPLLGDGLQEWCRVDTQQLGHMGVLAIND